MARRFTAVLSRGASRHPDKRRLEDGLLAALRSEGPQSVLAIPPLNDVTTEGEAARALRELEGDLIVLAWMYPRAAHWLLHYLGVEGHLGEPQVSVATPDAGREAAMDATSDASTSASRPRTIYCLDLRDHDEVKPVLDEVLRLINTPDASGATGSADRQTPRQPTEPAAEDAPTAETPDVDLTADSESAVREVKETVSRRWYPVIDFSRCTNCMECIDFCLFGVYGLDEDESILVEYPDHCRKGCPACSRVCPENAIMFPMHKSPLIAGASGQPARLKMDLSELFGAPSTDDRSTQLAERERDQYLRQSAGPDSDSDATSTSNRQQRERPPVKPDDSDELDKLIDTLDDLDL